MQAIHATVLIFSCHFVLSLLKKYRETHMKTILLCDSGLGGLDIAAKLIGQSPEQVPVPSG